MRSALLACFLLLVLCVHAQQDPEPKKKGLDPSRLFFGGNFGASFGSFTFLNLSPQVGYRVSPIFSTGGGVNFIYQSNKEVYTNYELKSTYAYAGMNVFGRVNPFRFLLFNVQPELNYVWGNTRQSPGNLEYKQPGKFVPSLLVGGGVLIPAGARASLVAMIQYDLLQNDLSPYGQGAFFSFGFNF